MMGGVIHECILCSHPPQSQQLLFYLQACTNFLVTSHGNVVRNRNVNYKFNAFLKVFKTSGERR
jgi:hypothetical protein